MARRFPIFLFFLLSPLTLLAQNGKLSGTITDRETKEPVPFAAVRVYAGGQMRGGSVADENGQYVVSPLTPGVYDVEFSSVGYQKRVVKDVTINFESTRSLNSALAPSAQEREEVVIETYRVPLIDKDNTSTGAKLTSKDIERLPTRNVNAVLATQGGVNSIEEGGALNIRGNRGGDNIIFVNGVRQFGNAYPPVETISEISVITGGIPAQYGDALGGIISVTTKGAAERYRAGVQYETSRMFDQFRYDLLGLNFSGPLWRRTTVDPATNKEQTRTLMGIYSAFQLQSDRDADPSFYGTLVARPDALDELRETPMIRLPSGAYFSRADLFGPERYERLPYRPNSQSIRGTVNATVDFQPTETILVSVGGTGNMGRANNIFGQNINPLNFENQVGGNTSDYQVFARFRQTFPNLGGDSSRGGLRNVYYQLQADYTRTFNFSRHPTFRNNYELYNYTGKFRGRVTEINAANIDPFFYIYAPNSDRIIDSVFVGFTGLADPSFPVDGRNTLYRLRGNTITQGFPGGFDFDPFEGNRSLANINSQIIQTEEDLENPLSSIGQLQALGGALNGLGTSREAQFDRFQILGVNNAILGYQNREQYRVQGQLAGDIGRHTLKIGFEYEQRVTSSWGAATSPWFAARRLLNGHIVPNSNAGTTLSRFDETINEQGVRIITITPDLPVRTDETGQLVGQSDFDRRVRLNMNLPANQLINIDELDPSLLNIRNFTVPEIFGDGQNIMTAWQGYDPYGNRQRRRVAFNDFFTDTINRPVDAFRPIYTAAFIEDKFEINDLIVRIGFRFDRFDANQRVLRDRYSLTRLLRAGDVDLSRFDGGRFQRPGTVGDDFAVYLDRTADQFVPSSPQVDGNEGSFSIVGFRDGNQFYNRFGQPVTDFREITRPVTSGGTSSRGNFFPLYDITRLSPFERTLQQNNGITLDAFEDFRPQFNLMPRLAFSFPISEDALFFAHYDILTQRPLAVARTGESRSGPPLVGGNGDVFANPLQYYNLARTQNAFIINPNLQPQKKIDYQLGFQQRLTSNSALKLSAFYSEIRDLIQVTNVLGGYPNAGYQTNSNIDFGVVKGTIIQYDFRKRGGTGFGANVNYTLQFAEGSASDFATALLNTANPNLRNVAPQNWDQRHTFKVNLDYRFDDRELRGPEIFGAYPLQNAGINMTFYTGSGLPYTRDGSPVGGRETIEGSINGARLPWQNRTGMRIDKSWFFKGPLGAKESSINVYVYVTNLFNQANVLNVYRRTGSPTDDGVLASRFGQNQIRAGGILDPELYAFFYNYSIQNPNFVSAPRRIRFGITYNF